MVFRGLVSKGNKKNPAILVYFGPFEGGPLNPKAPGPFPYSQPSHIPQGRKGFSCPLLFYKIDVLLFSEKD